MKREDLKNWTREQMKSEILRLHRKLELFGIKFEENPNNFSFSHNGYRYHAGKLVNDYVALKEENTELKERVKEQREKIDSLLKELEEEKGKTITIGDGTISMRADMWDTVNENRKLKSENNELRKRLEKLESDICGKSPYIVSEFHSFEGELWIKASTYDDVLLRLKNANERIIDLEQDIFNKSTDELKQVEKLSSENKSLKDENKALKQQNEYLKSIFESMSPPESPEIVMRKTGMFSEEEIQAHMKANKKIWEDMENTVSENAINKDTLIADFQDQHQQDCIRYNDMRTAYLVALDELARLREQFGIGR